MSFNHYFNGFSFQRSVVIIVPYCALFSYFQSVTSHYIQDPEEDTLGARGFPCAVSGYSAFVRSSSSHAGKTPILPRVEEGRPCLPKY